MCGIAGFLRFDGAAAAVSDLRAMAEALSHRGPDGEGFYTDAAVGLGHRRLSIIDLGGGRQPLANEDGTVWVTFNGEIYNYRELTSELEAAGHRFRTRSDSEVLVHAYEQWGDDCLVRLRGMFAFSVWDARRRRLFLARDRVGIKPLVYFQSPGLFAFASELQALRALPEFPPQIDLQALDLYLNYQYIPAPFSIYRSARKLPPAHYLVVEADGTVLGPRQYWELRFRPNYRMREGEWVERLDAELRDTVRLHLVSDVSFGAFLSGGLDSSSVVAYMSQVMNQPVKTFSIRFDSEEYDESPYARQVAGLFRTDHHEEVVRPDSIGILPRLVRHYGEPFADSSAVPTYYVSEMASRQVKMVLSGDGGDENFAGYPSYPHALGQIPPPEGIYRRLKFSVGNRLRAAGLLPPLRWPAEHWYRGMSCFPDTERERLWRPEFRGKFDGARAWFDDHFRATTNADLCSQYQHLDLLSYLPYDILTKVDVASMCHGLEVRVPLLDHKFMEFVAEIPSNLKLKRAASTAPEEATGKYLLKRNGERFFPKDFLHRRKRGFEVPIRTWFADTMRNNLEDRLLDRQGPLSDYFELEQVRKLIEEHAGGGAHHPRLWALLFLDEWLRQAGGSRVASDSYLPCRV